MPTKSDIRCVCSRKPLLGIWGIDDKGKAYVHVMIYKQSRIFGQVLFSEGVAHLWCRECHRWTRLRLRGTASAADLVGDQPPAPLRVVNG